MKKSSRIGKLLSFIRQRRDCPVCAERERNRESIAATPAIPRYGFWNGHQTTYFHNREQGNRLIADLLSGESPAMIARHGHVELVAAASYEIESSVSNLEDLHFHAGVFPASPGIGRRWAANYLESLREVDCLCEWNFREGRFVEAESLFGKYHPESQIVSNLGVLAPFREEQPWTSTLAGKSVLVIHPFEQSIRSQYEKRASLFENPMMLPEFGEFQTIKAVQTIAGNPDPRFADWFEAFEFLCAEIDRREFDVALIGAGGYGLPLAAHVKREGRKAVHIGGALQLLFGILGARWESGDLPVNEHWVRPLPEERPPGADKIESGCYW